MEISGAFGQEIILSSELSYDIDDDINSFYWTLLPIIRKEDYIDLNQNEIFDQTEPFYDINQNGEFEPTINYIIEAELLNIITSTATLIIPQTFEDTDIIVELSILDEKGAQGSTSTII